MQYKIIAISFSLYHKVQKNFIYSVLNTKKNRSCFILRNKIKRIRYEIKKGQNALLFTLREYL